MRAVHRPDGLSLTTGYLEKLGRHRTRAESRYGHSERGKLHTERLAEARHIGLGRRIDGQLGQGKEAGDRTDIQDSGGCVRLEHREKEVCQVRECCDIHREHRLQTRPLRSVKGAEIPQPGVINEQVERNLRADDVGCKSFTFRWEGKIRGNRFDREFRKILFERFRQGAQAFLAATDKDEMPGSRGKLAGKLGTESGGGSGHQRDAPLDGKESCHGFFRKISRIGCSSRTFASMPPNF